MSAVVLTGAAATARPRGSADRRCGCYSSKVGSIAERGCGVLASENRWVTLRMSAKGIKTVDKQGIEAVVRRLRKEGQKI